MSVLLQQSCKKGAQALALALWRRGLAGAAGTAGAGAERKTTKLKRLLTSPELSFLMEAHSGLSARIADEAGFEGVWGSGLSVSAQLGVRDCNEASWTQVLEVAEMMADAAGAPVLLDADTGYGNFNNARRLVRKLEQRGVAGCCIEDKCFPKTNSLLDNRRQPLADMDEFALKIQACKEAQLDADFCVVARVEALIAGWGLREALRRAEAYRAAGADAVLVHSKRPDAQEIDAFMAEWRGQGPVVIVPTKYPQVPVSHFRSLGVSAVIWANHSMRASVAAMQAVCADIHRRQSVHGLNQEMASVEEVFRLQREDELKAAEERFLPKK